MKKSTLITIVCTVIATLVLVLAGAWIISSVQDDDGWTGNVSFQGEIVEIKVKGEGKIITIVNPDSEESKQFWVNNDTALEGSWVEIGLADLLDQQICGAHVTVDAYNVRDDIVLGFYLYPAKSMTIVE